MARASRVSGESSKRSPFSRIVTLAPLPARPAAIVAPPMPEPMMTMSGEFIASMNPRFRRRIEEYGLGQVEGERRHRAGLDVGVRPETRDHALAAEIGDGECVGTG